MRANLWIVMAVLPLSACAVSAPPQSASARLGLPMKPADPESLEGWQSVVDQHAGALARLALGEARAPRERPSADETRPATPGATRPQRNDPAGVPPPPAPASEPSRYYRDELRGYPARKRAQGTSATERPLTRCERACLHVGAICYASQRICRIADRLEDASARQSCAGAQQRCLDAQEVARRAGCGACPARP